MAGWWRDVLVGVSGGGGGGGEDRHIVDQGLDFHNVGLLRVKRARGGDLVVVDGQQRLTTTSLLLAAVWHMGRRCQLVGGNWTKLEKEVEACLFTGERLDFCDSSG